MRAGEDSLGAEKLRIRDAVTINLAPADLKKEGSGFDLPTAMGILGAYQALLQRELPD